VQGRYGTYVIDAEDEQQVLEVIVKWLLIGLSYEGRAQLILANLP
jgi:hypothetical protein